MRRNGQHQPARRRAMVVMGVLVCLSIVMVLLVAWTKMLVVQRRQLNAERECMQADYLALSALERGAVRARTDAHYTGETWHVDAETLGERSGATVVIRVESVTDRSLARWVKVQAQFPDQSTSAARRSKQIKILLKKEGEAT
jgi:hypothetical protein